MHISVFRLKIFVIRNIFQRADHRVSREFNFVSFRG